jgi:hypothetical protein
MRIALHNIHLLPLNLAFHGYVLELLRQRKVTVLYFSDVNGFRLARRLFGLARNEAHRARLHGIDWRAFDYAFSARELRRKADVLLNLNLMCRTNVRPEFASGVTRFDGLKIFHVGDYFWYRPGSELNRLLERVGVDHLFGYAMHDRHCAYFRSHFPLYAGRVWGVPFGSAPRFVSRKPFRERANRAVAVGSVNPLRPLHERPANYRETAEFFPDESWFHKFRRQLVLARPRLADCMDSMLPEFPATKDFNYDLVKTFNEYRMFVSCESIFHFPSAKVFEGSACGTAVICADHACNTEYGFEDGRNCIMYKGHSIEDFREKVVWAQRNEDSVEAIAATGHRHVSDYFSHSGVADRIWETTRLIWDRGGDVAATPLWSRLLAQGGGARDRALPDSV